MTPDAKIMVAQTDAKIVGTNGWSTVQNAPGIMCAIAASGAAITVIRVRAK